MLKLLQIYLYNVYAHGHTHRQTHRSCQVVNTLTWKFSLSSRTNDKKRNKYYVKYWFRVYSTSVFKFQPEYIQYVPNIHNISISTSFLSNFLAFNCDELFAKCESWIKLILTLFDNFYTNFIMPIFLSKVFTSFKWKRILFYFLFYIFVRESLISRTFLFILETVYYWNNNIMLRGLNGKRKIK